MIHAIIYKTTCLVNGKIYIGQHYIHSQKTLDPWYIGSGAIMIKAIKRYGVENFKRDILCVIKVNKPRLINKLEEIFISKYQSNDLSIGYNVLSTAVNKDCPSPMKVPEIARKSAENQRRFYALNPEFRKKRAERIREVARLDSTRKKVSEALKGNSNRKGKKNSKEHNQSISKANKGRSLSEEHRMKISQSKKGIKTSNGSLGMKLSNEARLNMSKAAKIAWNKRKHQNIKE